MTDTGAERSGGFHISSGIIGFLSDVLSDAYTHARLDTLFQIAGAPGEPPEGSKSVKVSLWLRRINDECGTRASLVPGQLIEEFMDVPLQNTAWSWSGEPVESSEDQREKQRVRLRKLLAIAHVEYLPGGRLIHKGHTVLARQLSDLIRDRDLHSLEAEFTRATKDANAHPREALSAAANILEAVLGEIIVIMGLQAPNDRTLRNLWKPVKAAFKLDPEAMPDKDLAMVVGAMGSTVEGLSGLRNDKSVAHAMRPELARNYNLQPRHARLAINAAYGLTVFLLETLDSRRGEAGTKAK